jgi:hypothetical protein
MERYEPLERALRAQSTPDTNANHQCTGSRLLAQARGPHTPSSCPDEPVCLSLCLEGGDGILILTMVFHRTIHGDRVIGVRWYDHISLVSFMADRLRLTYLSHLGVLVPFNACLRDFEKKIL